jgi:hypothetical protein
MEVPSESFKGELGIEEPVILCEPRILTVNQWLADTKTVAADGKFGMSATCIFYFFLVADG